MNRRRSALLLAIMLCVAGAASAAGANLAAALTFTPPVHYDVGGKPADVACADVNGDGRLDIVTSAGDGLAILLGTAQSPFVPAPRVTLERRPGAIALADLNGDHAVDIVIADPGDDAVTVLLGDGTGSFVAKGTFPAGKSPSDVVVGDLTGDGVADVATANPLGDGVSVLTGDGTGNLSAPLDLPVGNYCRYLLSADFNADGTMDLAFSRYEWDEYSGFGVVLADGSGGFTPMGMYSFGGADTSPIGMALGDVNVDGRPDVVALQEDQGDGRIFTFLGDRLGAFVRANETRFSGHVSSSGIAAADLNNDGRDDVVTSGYSPGYTSSSAGKVPAGPPRIYVLLTHVVDGVFFEPTSFLAGRTPGEILLTDFNRDHRPDLATTDVKTRSVSVRMNGFLPVVTGVSPARGRVGDVVTLTGRHFVKTGVVQFGGRGAVTYLSWSATKIRVKVPSGTPAGRVKVTVTTSIGRSAARYFTRL